MKFRSCTAVVAILLAASMLAVAGDKKSASATPKLDDHARMELIRSLTAELVYARRAFPIGYKGLTIKDGEVTPGTQEVDQMIALYGPAVKPGDQAQITNLEFKGNKIIFEINGGPKKKMKWYDHITVGTGTGSTSLDPNMNDNKLNARGSSVTLVFDKYIPEMTPQQLKTLLAPVLNFDAKSPVEAYLDTVPPIVKQAIKDKKVLVGMNREMVTYALGRAPQKYRQDNYEEWIYGKPPDPVQFVRFQGDQVVRVEIMQVDGQKIVRTQKEVDLKPSGEAEAKATVNAQPGQAATADNKSAPTQRPTLMRPGEAPPESTGTSANMPLPGQRSPTDMPTPGGPPGGSSTPPGAPGTIPPKN